MMGDYGEDGVANISHYHSIPFSCACHFDFDCICGIEHIVLNTEKTNYTCDCGRFFMFDPCRIRIAKYDP